MVTVIRFPAVPARDIRVHALRTWTLSGKVFTECGAVAARGTKVSIDASEVTCHACKEGR